MKKRIECIAQVILEDTDGETVCNVTNHPGSILLLPIDEADALIAAGKAKEYVEPVSEQDNPPPVPALTTAESSSAVVAASAGPRFDETH